MQFLAFSCIFAMLAVGSPIDESTNISTDQPGDNVVITQPEKQTDFSYKAAFQRAQKSNRPLVVIVTATWCAPCQVMKNQTIKEVMAKDGFQDVILSFVDVDQEPALANNLTKGKGIPHVVVFEKNDQKWRRRTLFGVQTAETLQRFIKPKFGDAFLNPTEQVAETPGTTIKR